MDTEATCNVVRSRDDAPALRVAADDQGYASEGRVLQLLDCCKEGIEVEMRNDNGLSGYGRDRRHGSRARRT
jgi:hypothetical protein